MAKKKKARPKAYVLTDVESRNPDMPSPGELREGDLVKLSFKTPKGSRVAGESMWVVVKGRSGKSYKGILNSYPVIMKLRFGAPIKFQPRHVIDVWRTDRPVITDIKRVSPRYVT
jgi:hypothetical protein